MFSKSLCQQTVAATSKESFSNSINKGLSGRRLDKLSLLFKNLSNEPLWQYTFLPVLYLESSIVISRPGFKIDLASISLCNLVISISWVSKYSLLGLNVILVP